MDVEDNEITYINGIRQIIANIGPLLKLSWSASAAEELLLNLESTDENFHNYDLVRIIKSRIEKEIGPIVDDVVDEQKLEIQDQGILPMLNETITSSPEYSRLSQSVLNSVRSASEKILQTVYDNQDYPLSSGTEFISRTSHNWISCNDIDSMLSSSFEGDLMFASAERYERIAGDLKPSNARQVRLDAFNSLYQLPQSDIVSSEKWHVIRDRISLALCDDDPAIADKSLWFHAKMFTSGSCHLTREIVCSLCQSLTYIFAHSSFREVDLNDEFTVRALNQLRLLNQFQHYLPLYWIRFPEKTVHELVKATVDLLTISLASNKKRDSDIGPLGLIALIDPKANWFKKWMHGHHSRASLLERIVETGTLSTYLCKVIVDFHTQCKIFVEKSYQKLLIGNQGNGRVIFSQPYLKYTLFIHAVSIVEHLVLYKKGREAFPVKLIGQDFHLKDLFVMLIDILLLTKTPVNAMFMDTRLHHPGLMITQLLKSIAKSSSETVCACVCNDEVTNALLQPLMSLMKIDDAAELSKKLAELEGTLIIIADILSLLADSKCGRDQLLYGSLGRNWDVHDTSPAFTIAFFTKKVVLGEHGFKLQRGIADAYLFICRQFYVTGEGLFILKSFNFSACICEALEKQKKDNRLRNLLSDKNTQLFALKNQELLQLALRPKTASSGMDLSPPESSQVKYRGMQPISDMESLFDNYHYACNKGCINISHDVGGRYDIDGLPFCESQEDLGSIKILFSSLLSLKEDLAFHNLSLLDNLLSFAMTPKGVLLIKESGFMEECVRYLYCRHRHGFQVSKIDRCGYGAMLSQISCSGVGIQALESTGYIKDLLEDIWIFLEGGNSDNGATILPVFNEDMTDKRCQKLFNTLVNILSSFPGVPELLNKYPVVVNSPSAALDEPLTSATALPTPLHLQEFLNQVVLLDSDLKIKLLYHFEFTHLFGLQVLSCMICCLDTALLLETRYRYQEILLKLQEDFQPEKDLFVIDAHSLARNQILVRSYLIGGNSERVIPPRTLCMDSAERYKWPLFSTFPVPAEYSLHPSYRMKNGTGTDDFMHHIFNGEEPNDPMEQLKSLQYKFIDHLATRNTTKINRPAVKNILKRICPLLSRLEKSSCFRSSEALGSDTVVRALGLTEIETAGIELVLRYGSYLGLISSIGEAREALKYLYRRCRWYHRGQVWSTKSDGGSSGIGDCGFDWFVGTVFLIFEGSVEDSWHFLNQFLLLSHSGYLWPARIYLTSEGTHASIQCGIHPLYSSVCHNVELILQTELPQVYSAIRLSGYTSSQICQLWLRQCFWNYLDWDEICMYISTCLIMGIDYQIYFCVCLFHHLQDEILCHAQQKDLVVFLKEEAVKNFTISKFIKAMTELEQKYRKIVLDDLMESLK